MPLLPEQTTPDRLRVAGLDGWKNGWVMAIIDGERLASVSAITDLAAGLAAAGPLDRIGIDMPFPLLDGERAADALARAQLGRRASTVFSAPPLAALRATHYPDANAASRAAIGKGLSKQAWSLFPRIREVRAAIVSGLPAPVQESHPEVCFAVMTGGPLPRKASWDGVLRRIQALQAAGLDPLPHRGLPPSVAPDDVLDAIAVAWSARRAARRSPGLLRLPASAPLDPELGLPAQIVA